MTADWVRLARLYRVLPVFRDGFQNRREAPPETVEAILRDLGAPVDSAGDVAAAWREGVRRRWSSFAPPAVVAWSGQAVRLLLRTPAAAGGSTLRCSLTFESGEQRAWEVAWNALPQRVRFCWEGETLTARRLELPAHLPLGYHRLELETGSLRAETFVIAAPTQCFAAESAEHFWGVFLPLYALHSERSWGAGDFSDLAALFDWTRSLGGAVVGTLPLLAAFLDRPYEYSPYAPASRLFWNEFYVDPRRTPEWERSPQARALLDAERDRIAELRAAPLVDYQAQMALKRRLFEALAADVERNSERRGELERFVAERPALEAYAAFRAVVEKRNGETWQSWPERLRGGKLQAGDYDQRVQRYHQYVQWLADAQLRELAAEAGTAGLYLDLPLGVHPGGFDVWRQPESFAFGAAGGAPPDRFFSKGQNWGFAPLHPEALRRTGYRYWIDCLRHHMRYAGALRIDHFMGLHRLYWIPRGAAGDQGCYVQYPAKEMYAVACLESHRNRCRIVGEDLGTVPKYVRSNMRRRGVDRMYVAQFAFRDDPGGAMAMPPSDSLACVNTHDTPTFAAFWNGADIDDRVELGLLSSAEAEEHHEARERLRFALASFFGVGRDPAETLNACLQRLGRSSARGVLVSLEDLWLETEPQNRPGTAAERANWRRRAGLSLEQMMTAPRLVATLESVSRARQSQKEAPPGAN